MVHVADPVKFRHKALMLTKISPSFQYHHWLVWKAVTPTKVCAFLREAVWHNLSTGDRIQKSIPILPLTPILHYVLEEPKAFGSPPLRCPKATLLWNRLLTAARVYWAVLGTLMTSIHNGRVPIYHWKARFLWKNSVRVIAWAIWLERNKVNFSMIKNWTLKYCSCTLLDC